MFNKFDKWNEKKKKIDKEEKKLFIKQTDIWWCKLWKNIKNEIDWKWEEYTRPVLILRKLSKNDFIWIPLSSKIKKWTWFYNYKFKWKYFTALLSQIRMLSSSRLTNKIWQLDEKDFKDLKNKLKTLLNL